MGYTYIMQYDGGGKGGKWLLGEKINHEDAVGKKFKGEEKKEKIWSKRDRIP